MILLGIEKELCDNLLQKHPDKVIVINPNDYKNMQEQGSPYPINCLEHIKYCENNYDMVYVIYGVDILACLDAIKLSYIMVYNKDKPNIYTQEYKKQFDLINCNKIILENDLDIEQVLTNMNLFDWLKPIEIEQHEELEPQPESQNTELEPIYESKNKLTLEQLVDEDVVITDADVRDMKAIQNKLKVGMLLQAKSMLNRVLKLSNILDKLYDKLLDRIDDSLETTDTASLMYTAEYINKALSDTNQFMMSLINNEKIQNFFIIDNSTVINTASEDRVEIDKRQKIRKAAEIVLDNIDSIMSGDYQDIKNPNVIEVSKEEDNVSSESESV